MKNFAKIKKYSAAVNRFLDKFFALFVFVVVVALLLLGWIFLLQREYNSIRNSGILQYRARVAELKEQQAYLQKMQDMETAYQKLSQERLRQLQDVLPAGIDTVALMADFERLANEAHVTLTNIDIAVPANTNNTSMNGENKNNSKTTAPATPNSAPDSADLIQKATITVTVEMPAGSYHELKNFLQVLESFVPIFDLANLSYAPDATSMVLQFYTYYLDV